MAQKIVISTAMPPDQVAVIRDLAERQDRTVSWLLRRRPIRAGLALENGAQNGNSPENGAAPITTAVSDHRDHAVSR